MVVLVPCVNAKAEQQMVNALSRALRHGTPHLWSEFADIKPPTPPKSANLIHDPWGLSNLG